MKILKLFVLSVSVLLSMTMCTPKGETSNVEKIYDYDSVDVKPEFAGGDAGVAAYIFENVVCPDSVDQKMAASARILCSFIIREDGSVDSVTVVEPVDSLLDAEAIRVVNEMPAWSPAILANGDTVAVKHIVPVAFGLSGMVLENVEVAPQYPGGIEAMLEHIYSNIKIEKPADEVADYLNKKTVVSVLFEIDEEGNIVEPSVVNPTYELLDKEAVRIVKTMPKWNPAQKDGKPAKCNYVIPFVFIL